MYIQYDLDRILLDKGKIFLFDEITPASALEFCQKLKYLISKNKKKIWIYINSEGGDVDCANSIIDEIESAINHKFNINTVVCGLAASTAAVILAYGKVRYATKNSSIMLHPISYEITWDYHKFNKKHIDFAGKISENMIINLAKRCGYVTYKDQKKFAIMVEDSVWFTATEAIEQKIIDKIWTYDAEK